MGLLLRRWGWGGWDQPPDEEALCSVCIVRARDTWCSTKNNMNVAHGPPAQEVGLGRV